jgi:hypothetical protein
MRILILGPQDTCKSLISEALQRSLNIPVYDEISTISHLADHNGDAIFVTNNAHSFMHSSADELQTKVGIDHIIITAK